MSDEPPVSAAAREKAREVCDQHLADLTLWDGDPPVPVIDERIAAALDAFAAEQVAWEREACRQVAERWATAQRRADSRSEGPIYDHGACVAENIAREIGSRGAVIA